MLAWWREEAACGYASDVLEGKITFSIHLSISHPSFLPPPLFFSPSSSLSPFPSLFFSPPSHQVNAAMRGYHSLSPSPGSHWIASGGQGVWSGASFTRKSLQHYLSHHHHPSYATYAYCLAHTTVSTGQLPSRPLWLSDQRNSFSFSLSHPLPSPSPLLYFLDFTTYHLPLAILPPSFLYSISHSLPLSSL